MTYALLGAALFGVFRVFRSFSSIPGRPKRGRTSGFCVRGAPSTIYKWPLVQLFAPRVYKAPGPAVGALVVDSPSVSIGRPAGRDR